MEIKFKRDTAFRKQFFVPDSFAHPAKMDAQLLIWLVEHYSVPGETILDPMAGSGTLMLACGLGRNCILVELEEKFCKMMRDNWAEVKMRPQLGSIMGQCEIIQGDARNLEGLLCDKIISSPPYSDISMGGGLNTKPPREGHDDQSGRSPKSPSQLGAGNIDKCILSPPYAETVHHTDDPKYSEKYRPGRSHHLAGTAGQSEGNIGQFPYGEIDKIITSPPYEATVDGGGEGPLVTSKKNPNYKSMPSGYVDKVITSPPYEGSMDGGSRHTKGGIPERDKKMKRLGSYDTTNEANIGNLYKDTYLQAMLQVYQQCWDVLKSGGLLILVTKNFIRNKKVIRLDEDTIKLCEQAGFSFLERHYRKLPSQSFWRIIYAQKHPEVEQINHEDILVFQK